MELRMNPDVPFEEIQKAVVEKFTDAAGFFKNARMAISFTGRTLTATEEEILIQTITETTGVELLCITINASVGRINTTACRIVFGLLILSSLSIKNLAKNKIVRIFARSEG